MLQKRKTKVIFDGNIEWVLNLTDSIPRFELLQSNLKPLPKPINKNDSLLCSNLYTYIHDDKRFEQVEILLFPNMIVYNDKFLILSTCVLEKKKINYKEYTGLGLMIGNSLGQTHLFFTQYQELVDWTKLIKRFCKLQNFLSKYTLKERINIPNVFACVKNKTNQIHTVQIFRLTDFERNPQFYEQLMNEVNILMSLKHPCLLNYNSLYEDTQHLYVVYEYWVGDPLYKLIEQGLKLNQNQIAKITYQIIKCLKYLHLNNLYHAQITPQNIIILRNYPDKLQIALYNFAYREEFNKSIKPRLPPQWIAPEFKNDAIIKNPKKLDHYQVGCTLYYMIFYKPQIKGPQQQSFSKQVENLNIDLKWIQNEYKNPKSQISASQIDLLLNLMDPDPSKRKEMYELSNHHWFVNEEAKSKSTFKCKLLPSLKTILEIREVSSMDLLSKMQKLGDHPVSIQSYDSFNTDDEIDFLHLISDEMNSLPQHVAQLNSQTFLIRK